MDDLFDRLPKNRLMAPGRSIHAHSPHSALSRHRGGRNVGFGAGVCAVGVPEFTACFSTPNDVRFVENRDRKRTLSVVQQKTLS